MSLNIFSRFSINVKSLRKTFSQQIALYSSDPTYFRNLEAKYGSINYRPYPIVLNRGRNCHVWDVEGKRYLDWLACYATVNQGHCHPRIISTLLDQIQRISLTSRVFLNDTLGPYQKLMCETFGYDRHMPINTGVEGSESAVKLARRWGYDVKGIPRDQALMVFPRDNYWGRSISAISASTDPSSFTGFGPYTNGFINVPYNDLTALEELFKTFPNIAGYLLEPIQGEAGVIIPNDKYLLGVRELCNKYNVLMIADEVQSGLGRTGYLYACQHENVKPDILVLGKALSGGFMPISCVLTSNQIMTVIKAGQHGSTYGGNPLANAIGMTALDIILTEKLPENSAKQGNKLITKLENLKIKYPSLIKSVRGRGLMCAVEMTSEKPNGLNSVDDICWKIIQSGLLVKPTHDTIIRISPPLTISNDEIDEGIDKIDNVFKKIC